MLENVWLVVRVFYLFKQLTPVCCLISKLQVSVTLRSGLLRFGDCDDYYFITSLGML